MKLGGRREEQGKTKGKALRKLVGSKGSQGRVPACEIVFLFLCFD